MAAALAVATNNNTCNPCKRCFICATTVAQNRRCFFWRSVGGFGQSVIVVVSIQCQVLLLQKRRIEKKKRKEKNGVFVKLENSRTSVSFSKPFNKVIVLKKCIIWYFRPEFYNYFFLCFSSSTLIWQSDNISIRKSRTSRNDPQKKSSESHVFFIMAYITYLTKINVDGNRILIILTVLFNNTLTTHR